MASMLKLSVRVARERNGQQKGT